ncbi:hypothetical protein, partial [Rhizobium phaseoli]|uniref:hypothetical protein n=1 Tax=Rhizobium phaseoli TaxID=396 RepID=UPI001AED536C
TDVPSQAKEGTVKCLQLEQITNVHGPVSTFATQQAVKIEFRNINGYLLARAPDWKVVLVNQEAKLVFEESYEHWTSLARQISHSYMG